MRHAPDLTLTPDEQALIAAAQGFAAEVLRDAVPTWEAAGAVDHAVYRRAADLGLMAIELPVSLGGKGYSFVCKSRVCEALAAVDLGFALSVVNSHNAALRLAGKASATAVARFVPQLLSGDAMGCTALTEPGAGSDLSAMKTRARKVEGGWRIDGAKSWITNARFASTVIVFAQTGAARDAAGIGAFVIDASGAGVTRTDTANIRSLPSIGVGGFAFDDCFVPDDQLVLQPGTAFKDTMAALNGARIYVAAMCCGMVRAGLHRAAGFGTTREVFGKTLAETQAWRWPLARASAELSAATSLVRQAEQVFAAGEDAQRIAAEAKIFATEMAARQIPILTHAMGADGLRAQEPFARHHIAAGVAQLIDGSTEMLLDRVSRFVARDGLTA
ncbi:MAG: acyl-CoA dehydrogenase family protein [Pseudodonghicola sp.]|nr:acyl-CoA dehydrogenase family protein [Pseudodonghicola sp.]